MDVDGHGLLFPGEFVTSMNAAILLYNSSPEGTTISIVQMEGVIATAVL